MIGVIVLNLIAIIGLKAARQTPDSDPGGQVGEELQPISLPTRPAHLQDINTSQNTDNEVLAVRALAFDAVEAAVARLPDNPEVLCLLGKVHLRSGNEQGARDLWKDLIEREPDYLEAYVDLGYLEQKAPAHEVAAQYFERAIELAPDRTDIRVALSDSQAALGEYAAAIETLKASLEIDGQDGFAWIKLGSLQLQQQDTNAAIESLNRGIVQDPNSREALNGLASAYRIKGDSEKSGEYAQRLLAIDEAGAAAETNRDVEARDRQVASVFLVFSTQTAVKCLIENEAYVTAASILHQSLVWAPDSHDLARSLSDIYLRANDPDSALRVLRASCDSQPGEARRWNDLAQQCIRLRRFEPASLAAQRGLAADSSSPQLHVQMAQIQMVLDPAKAVASARRALELQPSANHHYVLATAHYHAGDRKNAQAELIAALKLDPNNAEYQRAYQEIARELGQ